MSVPTLVIHRTGDLVCNVENGRWLAREIPVARYLELPGDDHVPWVGGDIPGEIQEFLTGVREAPELDRVLATVLFTDTSARPSARTAELKGVPGEWRLYALAE